MMDRFPFSAFSCPPLTGASSMPQPRPSTRAQSSRATMGSMELMSTTTFPGVSPSRMPSGPQRTDRTSGESGSIVMTTSQRSATSRGDRPASAPSWTSAATAARERLKTVTDRPPFSRLLAMGLPMTPRPMKPIFTPIASFPIPSPFPSHAGLSFWSPPRYRDHCTRSPRKKGGSRPAGCYNGRAHAAAYFTGKAAYLTSKAVSFTSEEVFSMAGFA